VIKITDEFYIRLDIVTETVDELWGKMAELQSRMPLNSKEWMTVLARMDHRIGRLEGDRGE
jgi:hypothetical protein